MIRKAWPRAGSGPKSWRRSWCWSKTRPVACAWPPFWTDHTGSWFEHRCASKAWRTHI